MNQNVMVLIEHLNDKVADISYMMLAQAHDLTAKLGGKVIAILMGHNQSGLAADLSADSVIYVDSPDLADFTWDSYLGALFKVVTNEMPRLLLVGDTSQGAEMAAGLSARASLKMISYCRQIQAEGAGLTFTSQICGGKIMVEGSLGEETIIATMLPGAFKPEQGKSASPAFLQKVDFSGSQARVRLLLYIQPDGGDIDIGKEKILIGIGRGIQREDNFDLVNDLAEVLGGTTCATRPVIDQGWLPASRLVGKSGKEVKPSLYIGLGISGAPEHTDSIRGSDLIMAVNTDPSAPIFNIAQYGALVDILDLVPVLTEKIKKAKGI